MVDLSLTPRDVFTARASGEVTAVHTGGNRCVSVERCPGGN